MKSSNDTIGNQTRDLPTCSAVHQPIGLKRAPQKCCSSIYFNKQCLAKKIIPKYVNIKIANTSPAAQVTTKKAQINL
jgi:hypothetical protein